MPVVMRPAAIMAKPHRGSCSCRAVTEEVRGAPLEMGYCGLRCVPFLLGLPISTFALSKSEHAKVNQVAEDTGGSDSSISFQRPAILHPLPAAICTTEHPSVGPTAWGRQ